MKIVVFGDEHRVGAMDGVGVVDLSEAFLVWARDRSEDASDNDGNPRVPSQLLPLIEGGSRALDDAHQALDVARTMTGADAGPTGRPVLHPLSAAPVIHAPWPGRRIACAGGNFADHLARMMANRDGAALSSIEETTAKAREAGQWGFWKVVDEVAGPGDPIPKPRRTQMFDYEGEVAIVLGGRGKDVEVEKWADLVWGYTLLNDWSVRDGTGQFRPMSYNLAKNFDGCVSMGPAIVVGGDPEDVDVELRVNGELRQSYNSSTMIFSFGEILAEISKDLTLRPGDMISGGTAAGTAADTSQRKPTGELSLDLFLKPGDVVDLTSPQVGTLRNSIVEPWP